MALSFNYDISAKEVLHNPEMPKRFQLMRKAGLEHLWVFGYFYGHHESDPDEIDKARKRILDEGLQTGVISVPVGHPGNALNPEDPDLELALPKTWDYRVDRFGEKEYFCACINDVMTKDALEAARLYAQMGFTRHFLDDDVRLGNWGNKIQGCFCDKCIRKFNALTGEAYDRETLRRAADNEKGLEDIRDKWIRFNCDKVTNFVKNVTVPEMTTGFMTMHNGTPIHGISIPDIKKAVPNCIFRVGEMYFNDKDLALPGAWESLESGARMHKQLIGNNMAYSETTVFPPRSMSIENFKKRLKLEVNMGLRNIFLMSGTWFYSDEYWQALIEEKDALNALADELDAKK